MGGGQERLMAILPSIAEEGLIAISREIMKTATMLDKPFLVARTVSVCQENLWRMKTVRNHQPRKSMEAISRGGVVLCIIFGAPRESSLMNLIGAIFDEKKREGGPSG